jgi:phosphocarrier protein
MKIRNSKGLHARASARFVECASQFSSDIRVSKDGHIVGGDSIMGLMMLAASKGSDIHISATGVDADEAIIALDELVSNMFGEET